MWGEESEADASSNISPRQVKLKRRRADSGRSPREANINLIKTGPVLGR